MDVIRAKGHSEIGGLEIVGDRIRVVARIIGDNGGLGGIGARSEETRLERHF